MFIIYYFQIKYFLLQIKIRCFSLFQNIFLLMAFNLKQCFLLFFLITLTFSSVTSIAYFLNILTKNIKFLPKARKHSWQKIILTGSSVFHIFIFISSVNEMPPPSPSLPPFFFCPLNFAWKTKERRTIESSNEWKEKLFFFYLLRHRFLYFCHTFYAKVV